MQMDFSYGDFKEGWRQGCFNPPKYFSPYTGIEPRLLHDYYSDERHKKKSILDALNEIEKRSDNKYAKKLLPLARYSLAYATDVFPIFDLLYAEVIAEDWLGMVGWHKFQRDHLIHQPLTAYTVLKMLRGWNGEKGEEHLMIGGQSLLDHCVDAVLFNEECYPFRQYLRDMYLQKCNSKKKFADTLFPEPEEVYGANGEYDENLRNQKRNQNPKYQLWRMLFIETAFVAAMFHDIGYPWEYIQRLSKALSQAKTKFVLHHNGSDIAPRDFQHRLLYLVLNGYQYMEMGQPLQWENDVEKRIEDGLDETHGLPGALTFLLLNDIFRDYPKDKSHTWHLRQFVIEWASVAICMHDLSRIYRGKDSHGKDRKAGLCPERPSMRVSFDKDPLSSILCLADFIQDFERHSASHTKHKDGSNYLKFEQDCDKVSLKIDNNKATIDFHFTNDASRKYKEHYIKQEREELFFTTTGYLDFSSCGINEFDVRCSS